MSKVKIQGNASGTGVLTVTAPNTSTDRVITLPDEDVTLGAATPSIDDNGDATAITINSSEQVGIGVTSPDTTLHIKGTNQIAKFETTSGTGQNYIRFTGSSGNKGYFGYGGGSNDLLSLFNQENYDMAFGTNDTERMRILAGGGLTFNGDTAAANALDDYEEGTYTPVFKDTSNASMTGTLESCLYTKVGRLVHVMVYYSVSNSQNGNLSTMTLPFNQTGSGRGAGSITTYACPNANKGNEIYLNGGSKVAFWQVRDNATSIPMAVDNGSELILSITYMTA